MTLRSPWFAIPAALTAGLVLYLGTVWGSPGLSGLFLLLFLVVGLVGPLFAGVQLGGQAVASPTFRRRLLTLLAFPAGAGLLLGWMAGRQGELFLALGLVFMAMAFLSVCALLAKAAHGSGMPGGKGFSEASTSMWTLVLAGGVFCCVCLPTGCVVEGYEIGKAKSWVESASAEVRSVEKSTGRLPADLAEILPRIGPAPRRCGSDSAGYKASAETGAFQFSFQESGGLNFSWWIYDGRRGEWSYVVD
jgi:hypothetical protein